MWDTQVKGLLGYCRVPARWNSGNAWSNVYHTLKVNMVLNVHWNHKAYKGRAEGGEEGMKVEEEGIVTPCPKCSFLSATNVCSSNSGNTYAMNNLTNSVTAFSWLIKLAGQLHRKLSTVYPWKWGVTFVPSITHLATCDACYKISLKVF